MKQLKLLLLLNCVFILLVDMSFAQQQRYVIAGTIEGLPDGTLVYLVRSRGTDTVSRAITKKGKFNFYGTMSNEGEFWFIRTDTQLLKAPSKGILMTSQDIAIESNFIEWPEIRVSGSQEHTEYLEIRRLIIENQNKVHEAHKPYAEAYAQMWKARQKGDSVAAQQLNKDVDKYWEIYSETCRKRDEFVYDLAKNYPDSYYAVFFVGQRATYFKSDKLLSDYKIFSPRIQKSYYGTLLKNKIEASKGGIITNFKGLTPDGKEISLSELLAKSEYILLDFWASWCVPCREETPSIKRTFEKYCSKGFNVLSISMDKSETAWKRAIEKDSMTWYHILDNNRKSGTIADKYSIFAIPAFLLLDKRGNVIEDDLRGGKLERKLSELLGAREKTKKELTTKG